MSSVEGHKADEEGGAFVTQWDAERAGTVWAREVKDHRRILSMNVNSWRGTVEKVVVGSGTF